MKQVSDLTSAVEAIEYYVDEILGWLDLAEEENASLREQLNSTENEVETLTALLEKID